MTSRPPLPFGLGRDPQCDPSRCLSPGVPLPAAGHAFESALANLFSTFYATSLRYLGVSEILDWIEGNSTVEAWISTGLLQGRSPAEVGNDQNIQVGRGALRSLISSALNQNDEAWATSLREVGFSSGMSMAYEGIASQLMPTKNSPLPCLHTLITSSPSMLKSAPLKHSLPILPPRATPSSLDLINNIKALIANGNLSGPAWRDPKVWKPQIRRAHARYSAMVKEVAEDIVCAPSFSNEYNIFLDSISQPINLFDLISQDFDTEFPGAAKGLLGVGEVGGQNLIQIMDFCAAKRPSELLARVKLRVAERQAVAVTAKISEYTAAGLATGAECVELTRIVTELKGKDAAGVNEVGVEDDVEEEKVATFQQGSSKDLLYLDATIDPFSACAPRSMSPALQSSKGKGKALATGSGVGRAPSRYAPRPAPSPSILPNGKAPSTPASLTRKTANSKSSHTRSANDTDADHAFDGPSCCVACATALMQQTMSSSLSKPLSHPPSPVALPSSRLGSPITSRPSYQRPTSPLSPDSLPTSAESSPSFVDSFPTALADKAKLNGRTILPLPSKRKVNISPSSNAGEIKSIPQEQERERLPVVDAEAIRQAALADLMGGGIVAAPVDVVAKKKKKKKGKGNANGAAVIPPPPAPGVL